MIKDSSCHTSSIFLNTCHSRPNAALTLIHPMNLEYQEVWKLFQFFLPIIKLVQKVNQADSFALEEDGFHTEPRLKFFRNEGFNAKCFVSK